MFSSLSSLTMDALEDSWKLLGALMANNGSCAMARSLGPNSDTAIYGQYSFGRKGCREGYRNTRISGGRKKRYGEMMEIHDESEIGLVYL